MANWIKASSKLTICDQLPLIEEGLPVKYDVAADFAVLCSNCHRMSHRFSNPSDLAGFRTFINRNG
jgi:5-methylcytosine-specific restriction protein A